MWNLEYMADMVQQIILWCLSFQYRWGSRSLSADYGEEKSLALANKNSEQVMEALESLVKEGEK